MKKVLSLILALIMLTSVFCFTSVGASANTLISTYEDAKKGDLLYELKFGETTGVYTPTIFYSAFEEDLNSDKTVTILDGGRTIALYKPSLEYGALWYGDNIDGLSLKNNETYTITMELMLPHYRGGVYFNFPTSEKLDELKKQYPTQMPTDYPIQVPIQFEYPYSHMYGIYGRFDVTGDLCAKMGLKRINGRYKFTESGNSEYDSIIVEEGTFLNVALLIANSYCDVFIGPFYERCGSYLYVDSFDIDYPDIESGYGDLGFSLLMYFCEENKPMIVKNVNIYKGNVVSNKTHIPSYAKHQIIGSCDICDKRITTAVTTTVPVVTTPSAQVTTTADETTTLAPETTTLPEITSTYSNTEDGCGSAVTSGLAFIVLVSLAGIAVGKKHK